MAEAKAGDKVRVKYTGKLPDGTMFDTTDGRDPMEFTLGGGQVIAGFNDAIVGMTPGEQKSINVTPDNAYGERDPEIVESVPRQSIPPEIELAEGLVLEATQKDGQVFGFTVLDFNDETVTLDANHPLAGETLNFDVELVEIV